MKKTRFKLACVVLAFLMFATITGIGMTMENVAVTALGGVMTVTMMYIGGDSYRKS